MSPERFNLGHCAGHEAVPCVDIKFVVVPRQRPPSLGQNVKLSVDAAAAMLVPKKGDEAQLQVLENWLGSTPGSDASTLPDDLLQSMAERMSRQPEITHLRDDVALILAGLGGIATVGEVAAALLAQHWRSNLPKRATPSL